jgi:hypothetical protein
MNEQIKQLAKQAGFYKYGDDFDATKSYLGSKAAAELRRLHEVNAELVEAVKAALSDDQPYIEKCKTALAKAQGDSNG